MLNQYNFANQLKELRQEKSISQNQIANQLNIAVSTYANWEQGRTEPNIMYIKQIASCFNVSTDFLLGLSDDFGNVINNTLNETENYLVNQLRQLNIEKKQELISYANYLINKDSKQINSKNIVDISDLSDLEKAEVIGFINGLKKQSFTSQGKIVNKDIK